VPYVASRDLVAGVLAGDVRAVARLLSRAEAGTDEARDALDAMWTRAGRAHVVGITGVPGSGKSTLVTRLALAIRASGRKLGIVAIDPSSPFSGGAILGDRIRMGELGGDPGVFIRSMATRGALGGLARGTLEAVDVLDAAGYDVVLIETVGVGQDEVDIARAAHTVVVVSAPGLGDDIQAIKAGILEIADIHAVSKCDRPDANRTLAELKNMLAMGLGAVSAGAWRAPVIATSAVGDVGVAELLGAIDDHRAALEASGEIVPRRAAIAERRMLRAGDELLRDHFARHRDGAVALLLHQLDSRALSPHAAARRLLRELNLGGES
jgi:GTPase